MQVCSCSRNQIDTCMHKPRCITDEILGNIRWYDVPKEKKFPSYNIATCFSDLLFYDVAKKLIKRKGIKEAPVSLNVRARMRIPKVRVSIYCAHKNLFFSSWLSVMSKEGCHYRILKMKRVKNRILLKPESSIENSQLRDFYGEWEMFIIQVPKQLSNKQFTSVHEVL